MPVLLQKPLNENESNKWRCLKYKKEKSWNDKCL